MGDWIEGIQNALEYIESRLAEELEIREIAKRAYVFPFYFQRIFAVLCGVGVGEYIRNRRLTLAGENLAGADAKVIGMENCPLLGMYGVS